MTTTNGPSGASSGSQKKLPARNRPTCRAAALTVATDPGTRQLITIKRSRVFLDLKHAPFIPSLPQEQASRSDAAAGCALYAHEVHESRGLRVRPIQCTRVRQ